MRLLVTCERPSPDDVAQLKRAYVNLGAPFVVYIPQHDAKRVMEPETWTVVNPATGAF